MQYDLTHWDPDLVTDDKYLFLAVDHFTKYAFGRPLPDKTARSVHNALVQMFDELQVPKKTLADNGGEFRGEVVQELLRQHQVLELHGVPYHKTTNGGAERINRTIATKVCCDP
jgi:IS30 family transposase